MYARNLAGAHWQSELCYGRRGDSESDLDIRVRPGVTVTASGTQAGKPEEPPSHSDGNRNRGGEVVV